MQKLSLPTDEQGVNLVARQVFDLCISKVKNADLKRRFRAISQQVHESSLKYDAAVASKRAHKIIPSLQLGGVSQEELLTVYNQRMVGSNAPGRKVYDRILSAAPLELCPLCGLGSVMSLDHHLPKSEFPILCVTPNNLVPACEGCQRAKREQYPSKDSEQTLHPYFDDSQSSVWLQAKVVGPFPAVFKYFVDPLASFDRLTIKRLEHHMKVFDLPKRFSVQAAQEGQSIRLDLMDLHQNGGASAVRAHLRRLALNRELLCKNSWRTAFYRAASKSDWFCEGGFDLRTAV